MKSFSIFPDPKDFVRMHKFNNPKRVLSYRRYYDQPRPNWRMTDDQRLKYFEKQLSQLDPGAYKVDPDKEIKLDDFPDYCKYCQKKIFKYESFEIFSHKVKAKFDQMDPEQMLQLNIILWKKFRSY